jgi:hypothetical protein
MAEKPGRNPSDSPPEQEPTGNDPGHYTADDRGNMTWEWKADGDLLVDDALGNAERLRLLVDPGMDVADEYGSGGASDPAGSPPPSTIGYDPYSTQPVTIGKPSRGKPKDLRQLSKWIAIRKKLSRDDGEE